MQSATSHLARRFGGTCHSDRRRSAAEGRPRALGQPRPDRAVMRGTLRGNQRHSEALRGTQRHSEALKGSQRHLASLDLIGPERAPLVAVADAAAGAAGVDRLLQPKHGEQFRKLRARLSGE